MLLFRDWLRQCLTVVLDGRTLISTHEERPNNWGTAAGASRMAVALYLGDTTQLERCAQVFHGWLGDRSAYAGFDFGDELPEPIHVPDVALGIDAEQMLAVLADKPIGQLRRQIVEPWRNHFLALPDDAQD